MTTAFQMQILPVRIKTHLFSIKPLKSVTISGTNNHFMDAVLSQKVSECGMAVKTLGEG